MRDVPTSNEKRNCNARLRNCPPKRCAPQYSVQISEGPDLTLPDIVQYLPDVATPEKPAAMDAELKTIQ